MAIRFKRVQRLCDPTNKEAGKKVYPVISYQYDTSATLDEFAKEISSTSGVSEGETISVLKDFRTLLRKTLLSGRSVNIKGLGYFFLSAQSKGTEKAENFTVSDISGLRVCFRANSDIRLFTGTSTRSDGLKFKDLDHINDSSIIDGDSVSSRSSLPAPCEARYKARLFSRPAVPGDLPANPPFYDDFLLPDCSRLPLLSVHPFSGTRYISPSISPLPNHP